MAAPDSRNPRIEAFNRILDAQLDPDAVDAAGKIDALSSDDRVALELAQRLARMNPSRESTARHPLRRRLRALAAGENRRLSRRDYAPGFQPPAWLPPTAGLSISLALVFVFAWTLAGWSFSSAGQAVTPTAYYPPQPAGLSAPLPPHSQPLAAGFSPQPIPTPAAPGEMSAGTLTTQGTGSPRRTPALTSASPITP